MTLPKKSSKSTNVEGALAVNKAINKVKRKKPKKKHRKKSKKKEMIISCQEVAESVKNLAETLLTKTDLQEFAHATDASLDDLNLTNSESEDPEYEDFCTPNSLLVSNLHIKTSYADIERFFDGIAKVDRVELHITKDAEGMAMKKGTIGFESHQGTKDALQKFGESLHGQPVFLVRCSNHRTSLRISGFDCSQPEKTIKLQIMEKFQPYGKILKIFLPKDSGHLLGFGYIYLDQTGTQDVLDMDSTLMGDSRIHVRQCEPRLGVIRAEM